VTARWRPLTVVGGLLLLLTYLLLQSRSPDLALRARLHEALHAFELHDAWLTRDILLARAGLLPHYDALAQASRGLSEALETLRQGSQHASGEASKVLGQHVEAVDAALRQRLTLIEHFTTDNALLRNSLMYVLHVGETLRVQAEGVGQEAVAVDIGTLSHALLRFLQTPQHPVGEELAGIVERLPPALPFSEDLPLLVAHGRLIVDMLPQVDMLLRQIIATPTTTYARALREVTLQHYGRVEDRAQIFRWLLYLVAVALLGYLLYLFTRLRAQTRHMRQANADLRREMAERQQTELALRASEERFRAITESASEAIISADQTGAIVSWNAGAQAIFGYEAAEVLGMPLAHLMPTRYRQAHTHAFGRWTATGDLHLLGTTLEWAGVRKDGREFPLELSLSTWSTAQGKYVTGIIRDLTARKRLEEQTRQQELQLIQANKMTALGTLVSGVAHEINNPNQLVLMNASLLRDAWQDALGILDAYQRDCGTFSLGGLPYMEMRETLPALVQDVRDGAVRIERIITDLRDFARPRTPGSPETFALNEAVQRALRLLTPLIRRKTRRFHVDLAADVPRVRGESQQVEQIVVNLVVNALEALPDSERGVTVSTRFEPAEHGVSLAVEDEGIGISPEHLARLCDPFFTTKQASGGTGLGLAITSTLVRAHQGRLTFSSEPGRGTRTLVTLPCLDETPPSRAQPMPDSAIGVADSRRDGPRTPPAPGPAVSTPEERGER
jgi:PAS domain S-box-containing protein